jgi:RimJ/RimL family protein N-acetyltransferase
MERTSFNIQPTHLQNELVSLQPLHQNDFEELYVVASDPLVWEQHPNKNRYERAAFENFFKGAIESKGAFLIKDIITNKAIGSSRYYVVNEETKSTAIGYTFFARSHWGNGYNRAVKNVMLDYAFEFNEHLIFHVGAANFRSQKAVEKLGAQKIDEVEMAYVGEPVRHNFIYQIEKSNWNK